MDETERIRALGSLDLGNMTRVDMAKLTDDQKELRRLRKALRDLTKAVEVCASGLDDEMGKPSDVDRGKRIAAIANHLTLHNDMAKRFGLGQR